MNLGYIFIPARTNHCLLQGMVFIRTQLPLHLKSWAIRTDSHQVNLGNEKSMLKLHLSLCCYGPHGLIEEVLV